VPILSPAPHTQQKRKLAALLPVEERVVGPEHPDTLATRASLGYWARQAGDGAGDPGPGAV
jgi:hypothetical protein